MLLSRKTSNSHDLWLELFAGQKTSSGYNVNINSAVGVSAVFGCNRVIANGIAQPPLKLMLETDKARIPARDHPLYYLMSSKPNRWQTSFQWRQMVSWHVELTGNHFSFINRLGNRIIELFPFQPDKVEIINLGRGEYEYKVYGDKGETQTFPQSAILHLRGPSYTGIAGMDIIKIAREAIGLSIAAETASGSLHSNGVRPSGVYTVDGELSDTQYKALATWVHKFSAGGENVGKPLILDKAAKWQSTQMTGVDAQTLETRKYQVEEVCRFYGVNPIMVQYSDKATTYASAEQMFIAHDRDCLAPRWTNYEQEFDAQLLTDQDRKAGYYFDFVEEGMIRGSIRDTKDVILGYVNGGLMTPNEGRAKLDMNPDPDPKSNELRIPVYLVGEEKEPTSEEVIK